MGRKRRGTPIHGWLVIDKPKGLTSNAVVGRVKRITNAAKVGHGGTLDPLATGLLPLALGEATKTVSYVMAGAKEYRFTIRWGEARNTDDAEGEVTETSDVRPAKEQIVAVFLQQTRANDHDTFVGKFDRVVGVVNQHLANSERIALQGSREVRVHVEN